MLDSCPATSALCRVSQQVSNLGWVDFDYSFATVGLFLHKLMENWLNWLNKWPRTNIRNLLGHRVYVIGQLEEHSIYKSTQRLASCKVMGQPVK